MFTIISLAGCAGSGGGGSDAHLTPQARGLCAGDEDFDIPLSNAVEIWNMRLDTPWGPDVRVPWNYYSLETVVLHETGHIALLGHNGRAEHTSSRDTVMYGYFGTGRRLAWLREDDLALIDAYGARELIYLGVGDGEECDYVYLFGNPGMSDDGTMRHLASVKARQKRVIFNDEAPWFLTTPPLPIFSGEQS